MQKAARLSQTAKRRSKHNCVVRIGDAIRHKIDRQKGTAPEKCASPQPPTAPTPLARTPAARSLQAKLP
jgi:hypothetical protein